jgi:hypothetical protein
MERLFSKLILVALGAALLQCSGPAGEPRGIFSALRPNPALRDVFAISQKTGGVYELDFDFWKKTLVNEEHRPAYSLHGRLTVVNQSVRFNADNLAEHFVLFDFGLRQGASRRIPVLEKISQGGRVSTLKSEHMLALDTCFFDETLADSVFKFRLAHVVRNASDLVFFLGKRTGAQGIYHGRLLLDENARANEEIYSWRGNIYQARLPLKNTTFVKDERILLEKF